MGYAQSKIEQVQRGHSLEEESGDETGTSDEAAGDLACAVLGRGGGGAGGGRAGESASGGRVAARRSRLGGGAVGGSRDSGYGGSGGRRRARARRGLGGSGRGRRRRRAAGGVPARAVAVDLDALPGAALVTVRVLAGISGALGTHVILDDDALVVAQEGSRREVGDTTGPVNGALGVVLLAGDPGAELDLHGSLGEAVAARSAGGAQGTDGGAVDDPLDGIGSPVDRVGIEAILRVIDGRVAATVVDISATFAKVVGLDLLRITTEPLPVDLVEIVGLQDKAGDDTSSEGSPHSDVDLAEEDVLVGGDGGGIILARDAEDGTEGGIVGKLGSISNLEEVARALGEVDGLDRGTDSWVGRARWNIVSYRF